MSLVAAQPTMIGRSAARARRCVVRVEVEGAIYVGKMYIPDGKRRVSDVLADDRSFLNLTDVSIDGSEVLEEYLAVNKDYVRTLRILDEGESKPPVHLV